MPGTQRVLDTVLLPSPLSRCRCLLINLSRSPCCCLDQQWTSCCIGSRTATGMQQTRTPSALEVCFRRDSTVLLLLAMESGCPRLPRYLVGHRPLPCIATTRTKIALKLLQYQQLRHQRRVRLFECNHNYDSVSQCLNYPNSSDAPSPVRWCLLASKARAIAC